MNNVIGTKVKFSRNLKDAKFVINSTHAERVETLKLCLNAVNDCGLKGEELINISDSVLENMLMSGKVEMAFASNLTNKGYASNQDVNIEINGKNHIEIFSENKDVFTAYSNAKEIDKKLCNKLNFAYSDKYGFLTPDLKYLGSGMSIECKVLLPALTRINAILNLPKANEKLIFNIKRLDENEELYLISTNGNLGYSEKQICELTHAYIDKIVKFEIEISKQLAKDDNDKILDDNERAKAILKHCIKTQPKEVMELLSNIVIAINAEVENDINIEQINNILDKIKYYKNNEKEIAKEI
ncbi:MAG: hypothetical protein IJA72_05285, partial [Clostridia bacterium]|nr:hypothetical protein [Clostridia bacterium]